MTENDENRDPGEDAEGAEDLEVTWDEAEGVAGGKKKNPDLGGQKA